MNLLLVDDQISVLNGILSGVNFSALDIDNVYTAIDAAQAREIIKEKDINILLSDIEMPGENGLSLNKWVSENYSSIIRILLTSHASFDYARESMKFGCFDYIVQPAPYHEIEDAIRRAVAKILTDRQNVDYYNLERMSSIVLNLFSKNPANSRQSLALLNEMGYVIKSDSAVQTVIVEIYPYTEIPSPGLSDLTIFTELFRSAQESFSASDIYTLACLNRYKQFVILLYCNGNSLCTLTSDNFQMFYQEICRSLTDRLSCYVCPADHFNHLHEVIWSGHLCALNNVARKPGLYFSDAAVPLREAVGLPENAARWNRLLENGQFDVLEDNIFSFLDYNASLNRLNLENLSEFHQELTKIFFVYSYNRKIDIMSLFSDDYTYNDYMGCFKNVESLKKGISFLKNAISHASSEDVSKDVIQRSIDYILANLSRDLSVKDVAEYVNFSPEYFSKLFKKETGENVKNYILRIKVDAAKDLLKNPNIPISMVASELGYSNFSHFTQMFRKHENMTPSEYRKQFLKGDIQS